MLDFLAVFNYAIKVVETLYRKGDTEKMAAPKGNENAKKEVGRGRTLGLYITVEEERIVREVLRGEGKDAPLKRDVDARARLLFKLAVQETNTRNEFSSKLKTDSKNT